MSGTQTNEALQAASTSTFQQNLSAALVKLAMGLLVLGMLISLAADLRVLWYLWQGTGQPPNMTQLHWVAQGLWAAGAILLIPPALMAVPPNWILVVLQGALFVSCFFPAFDLNVWQELVGRTLLSVAAAAVLAMLGKTTWMTLLNMFLPWYWWQVFRGKHGSVAASIIGSEFLGWGYALYGLNPFVATILMCAGSIYLVRMSQMMLEEGLWGARPWLALNWFYVGGGLAKLAILTLSFLIVQ